MPAKLLEKLAKNEGIKALVLHAEDQELHWLKGAKLNNDIVTLKAEIHHGLWNITLEVEHGSVTYRSQDPEGYLITIETSPNRKFIKHDGGLSEEDISKILAQYSNSISIDLKDIHSLKKAKELLKDDYVLKHIPLANPTQDSASRLVIWHIRAYRKLFMSYQKKFAFLWEGLGLANARAMAAAMRDKGLI